MLLIGLTGSIATGKSTISSLLSSPPHSLPIIDADVLARQVVAPGTDGYRKILAHFGPTTPDLLVPPSDENDGNDDNRPPMPPDGPDGKGRPLNRPALGRRVFGNTPERTRDRAVLNGIVHPAVRWEMARLVMRAYLRGCWAVVLDIPLLFESSLDRFCGVAMVVAVRDPAVQMRRLMQRDPHLTAEDAENRVRSQTDVRDKARRCEARGPGKGVVLWNDGSREELAAALAGEMERLKSATPEWWGWVLLACPPLAAVVAAWRFWDNVTLNKRWARTEQETKAKL